VDSFLGKGSPFLGFYLIWGLFQRVDLILHCPRRNIPFFTLWRNAMAAIPRELILARRNKLEAKQNKIKAFQEKIREEEKRLAELILDQEEKRQKIIGRIMAKRMEEDPDLRAWFNQEINKNLNKKQERDLFF
jgi:hypothetical protein